MIDVRARFLSEIKALALQRRFESDSEGSRSQRPRHDLRGDSAETPSHWGIIMNGSAAIIQPQPMRI